MYLVLEYAPWMNAEFILQTTFAFGSAPFCIWSSILLKITHILNSSFFFFFFPSSFSFLTFSSTFPGTSTFTNFHCAVMRLLCIKIPFWAVQSSVLFFSRFKFHFSCTCYSISFFSLLFFCFLVALSLCYIISSYTNFLHASSCNLKFIEKGDSDSLHPYITYF